MTSCLVTKLTSDTILHVAHSWETIRKIPDFEKVAGEKLFRRYVRTNERTNEPMKQQVKRVKQNAQIKCYFC
jgi:hypothetical protein